MVDSQRHPPRTRQASHSRTDSSRTVRVQTGARLHFGLLTEQNQAGRSFGGCGLMIDQPGCDLELRLTGKPAGRPGKSVCLEVSIPETLHNRDWIRERICLVVHRCQQYAASQPENSQSGSSWSGGTAEQAEAAYEVLVHAAVPPHQGLGAGTQLALAVASGLALLRNGSVPAAADLAERTGRGLRSAVGLHGFLQGGFLVDGGKPPGAVAGGLAARVPFPADWRVVLLAPVHQQGLSGEREVQAFAQAVRIPREVTSELCRKIVMELLPALSEADFPGFSCGLYEYGSAVGECFRPAQGGRYAAPELESLVTLLRKAGVAGTGQTSWGPSVFALCPTLAEAEELARAARNGTIPGAGRLPCDCTVAIAAPLNQGAALTVSPSAGK